MVLKFGGTSVGSIERILHAAKIIKKEHESGNKIIVVVSAMAGKTNELINMSNSISDNFNKRELDVILSTGEQVSCSLLSGALNEIGVSAKSWMNWQIPILTEGEHTNSRIINMNIDKINNYAKDHSCSETKLLSQLRRETELKCINPIMLSGEYQGRLLSLISKIKQPKKILEIGTFTGYATLCLAEGLETSGKIYTIDKYI